MSATELKASLAPGLCLRVFKTPSFSDLFSDLSSSMPGPKLKVAVLVSGGVDSSVALRLLHAARHSCTAFYLKIWFQGMQQNSYGGGGGGGSGGDAFAKSDEQWQWDRDAQQMSPTLYSDGQGGYVSKSFYSNPNPGANQESGRVSSQVEQDMEIGYEENAAAPRTLEDVERRFRDDIMKLIKEQDETEDAEHARHKEGPGLFEPIHGSAPDIAGQDKANPLATILSAAMLLRYGLGENKAADIIEAAVMETLDKGFRTGDIFSAGNKLVGCKEMGDQVLNAVDSRVSAPV